MLRGILDKIMFIFFIAFLLIGVGTFNFYNHMSIQLRRISLIISIVLLSLVIAYILLKKYKNISLK